jgi:hypothetical protein
LLTRTACGRFEIAAVAPLADLLRVPATILHALSRRDPDWSPRLARVLWGQLTAAPGLPDVLPRSFASTPGTEGHDTLAKYLAAYATGTGAKVLVTSRIAGYVERSPAVPDAGNGTAALCICPFEQLDTENFIARFFARNEHTPEIGRRLSGELRHKVPVAGMAENPLLATLLCMAYWPEPRRKPLAPMAGRDNAPTCAVGRVRVRDTGGTLAVAL